MKKIDISHMDEQRKRRTIKEARILEVLNHPNIVRFKEVYGTKSDTLTIVMEHCNDGDLR